ncbi:SpoIIE family protein phosphatase [Vibrio sp. NTOU-M3]|uniref:SpoIIE family protein phosphatase n=1 Tax=Vibrio sp. NTOU-M3 TaxID=3234954 RepID=UPI00349F4C98
MGFEYCVRVVPYFGELEAGDGVVVWEVPQGLLVVVIDVLGHGQNAAQLARQMEYYIQDKASMDIEWLMSQLHKYFIGSIGAAATMVFFNRETMTFKGVGIGNTLLRRCAEPMKSFHAQPGVVGELLPTLRPFSSPFSSSESYLFTTDGIKENLDFDQLRGACHGSLSHLAAFLIDNFSKRHDDATVIAVRYHDG